MALISEGRSNHLPSFAFKKNKQLFYPVEQRNANVPSLQALDLFLKELKKHSLVNQSQYLDLQRIKVRDTNSLQKVVLHMWFIFKCYYIMNLRNESWRALQLFSCEEARVDPEHWRTFEQNFLPLLLSNWVLFYFFLPSKSPILSSVIPFWWLRSLKDIILCTLGFFLPGNRLCYWTVEVVEATSIENHICADLGSALMSTWFSHTCPVKSLL